MAERLVRSVLLLARHAAVESAHGVSLGEARADHLDRTEELTEDQHLLGGIALEDLVDELLERPELRVLEPARPACEVAERVDLSGHVLGRKRVQPPLLLDEIGIIGCGSVLTVELVLETGAARLERAGERL